MILLIDVGNTRVKWARTAGAGLADVGALAHAGAPAVALREHGLPEADAVWVSCVKSINWDELEFGLRQVTGRDPHRAVAEPARDGLVNSYAEPARMGSDRWLAMLALWAGCRAAFCVVSAGTALTLDRVDSSGQHLGGLIATGLTSAQHALLSVTKGRPSAPLRPYGEHLGCDTETAVRQAAYFSSLGVIERGLRSAGETPDEARVITGGDATALLPALGARWNHRPHLVLEGLEILARHA